MTAAQRCWNLRWSGSLYHIAGLLAGHTLAACAPCPAPLFFSQDLRVLWPGPTHARPHLGLSWLRMQQAPGFLIAHALCRHLAPSLLQVKPGSLPTGARRNWEARASVDVPVYHLGRQEK